MSTAIKEKVLLSPKEVYQRYGIREETLLRWRTNKEHLPYAKIGHHIRYEVADIEAFIKKNKVNIEV
jgi:predicted DNA-binding transcriptional regulator AlpA